MSTIRAKVISIISQKAEMDPSEIKDSDNLYNVLGIDSLDYIEIIIEIEEYYHISIPDEDVKPSIDTSVGDIVTYLENIYNM